MKAKKAIIIGASSGIGKELAIQLSRRGYEIGLTARRTLLLKKIQSELPGKSYIATMDVSEPQKSRLILKKLIDRMGKVDLIVINAGLGIKNPNWRNELEIVQTNVNGFTALANFAYHYFSRNGGGCLAGVSSIAGIRGSRQATAYSASKAFMSNYMEGLRMKARKERSNVNVMDVIPGFVETEMTKGLTYKFWVSKPDKACIQIIRSLKKNHRKAFVTRKWTIVARIYKHMPEWLLSRL